MSNKTSTNGKGDKPRNCFSSDFKNNYDQINWRRVSKEKVSRYPIHLLELMNALTNSELPVDVNDNHKIKDFDIYPRNKKKDKLFDKYDLDESVKDKYIWEVVEMMYDYIPF
jgi:hypothetical protein